jgi:predicted membrane protein
MRNQGQFYLGIVVVVAGVALLFANLFDINLGVFCWPLAFILLGVFLIFRPRTVEPGTTLTQKFLGEIERHGAWPVQDEEIWYFIGDVELDMTEADIPKGETRLRVWSFINDVKLRVPKDVGVALVNTAFISEINLSGDKEDSFFGTLERQTENYQTAVRKIRLETTSFINDVKVRQA